MNRSRVLLFFMLFAAGTAWSQTGSVEGLVIDARTLEPLPFANIFINNTTLGVAANAEGHFTLQNVPPGTHDVVFSFVGYDSYQARYAVQAGEATRVNIRLIESEHVLDEVAIKGTRDKTWEKQMKKFERIFLGDDSFGRKCKITNPWVVDLQTTEQGKFTAKAQAPVEIVNEALGYKLSFHLKDFTTDGESYSIVGNARFEEMQSADANVVLLWTNNRMSAFRRSPRYFFKSLIEQRLEPNGFRLYKSVGPAAIMRSTSFETELVNNIKPFKPLAMIEPGNSVYELKVLLKDRIEVHNINEPTRAYFYKDVGHSVSWLEAKGGSVRVTPDGVVLNSKELVVSGDMSLSRVAEMLPLDYKPGKAAVLAPPAGPRVQIARYEEKAHLHLDKPYYYPGETVWARAHMAYRDPGKRDTLSNVLYIDFLNPAREVIQSRMLLLDSLPYSNFRIPPSLPPGLYSIRTYSNWMLNYGESATFTLAVPVLDPYEKLVTSTEPGQGVSRYAQLQTDKPQYGTRELVQVTLEVTDEEGNPSPADVSVSVVDMQQVGHVSWSRPITETLSFSDFAGVSDVKFTHRVEKGFTLYGRYANDKKKPVKGDLTLVQGNFEGIYESKADAYGGFQVHDLNFYDSATFSIQTRNKNAAGGQVRPVARPFPVSGFKSADYKYETEKQQMLQRVLSVYEIPDEAIVLQEVKVNATPIDMDKPVLKIDGHVQTAFNADALAGNGGSLGTVLQGMMPGFTLVFKVDHWYFLRDRSAISSGKQFLPTPVSFDSHTPGAAPAPVYSKESGGSLNSSPGEPALVIDDVLFVNGMGETVGDRLQAISASSVQMVDINSVAGSNVGAMGTSGVISIVLKKGTSDAGTASRLKPFSVKGFERPSKFRAPDYTSVNDDQSRQDSRSTIYWNPSMAADSNGTAHFSFYTSDVAGTYLITVEGLSPSGTPVRSEQRVTVVRR